MKTCIVAIAKNEDNYIKEWVDYHLNLGVNHIFLYDNNDEDKNIMNKLQNNNVTILDVRGKKMMQNYCYNECYKKQGKNFDWYIFIDIDEFIYLTKEKNINVFLSKKKFNNCNCVRLSWRVFTDNNLLYVINNNYSVNRFTKSIDSLQCKSIIRGGLTLKYEISAHGSRSAIPCFNAIGENINYYDRISKFGDKPLYKECYIKHYQTKTLEEFLLKIERGCADKNEELTKKYLNLDLFFRINEKTKEKMDFLEEKGLLK